MIRVSYTMLNNFLTCMAKFDYIYFDGIEEEKNKWAIAGTSFHDAVSLKLNLEEAFNKFDIEIPYQDLRSMAKDGYKNLLLSYKNKIENAELEKKFGVEFDDFVLSGIFDVVLFDESPYGIIDWKLSKSNPTQEKYLLQASIYYIAFKELYDKKPDIILFVNPYKNKSVMFREAQLEKYSKYLLDNLIPYVVKYYKNDGPLYIRTGLFKGMCKYCGLKEVCLNGDTKAITDF